MGQTFSENLQVQHIEMKMCCGDAATDFNDREGGKNGRDPRDAVHCQACETGASGTRETRLNEMSTSGDSVLEEQEVRCR